MAKILFVVSGATYWVLKDGTRHATGYWAEEFANPYQFVTDLVAGVGDDLVRVRELLGPVTGCVPGAVLQHPVRGSADYEKYLRHSTTPLVSARRIPRSNHVPLSVGTPRSWASAGRWRSSDVEARPILDRRLAPHFRPGGQPYVKSG